MTRRNSLRPQWIRFRNVPGTLLALHILEATTVAVKRRKLKTPLDFGLS
jgi:hypothetical protein